MERYRNKYRITSASLSTWDYANAANWVHDKFYITQPIKTILSSKAIQI